MRPRTVRLHTHVMDNDLKQKYAPRRAKRHATFPSMTSAATWAASLDWRRNKYDFFRLCQALFDYLDARYRENGFRIDRFVSREELMRQARQEVDIYKSEKFADCIDVFRFLYVSLDPWIGGRAIVALERRRDGVEVVAGENAAY
jgi:hypothetical protein